MRASDDGGKLSGPQLVAPMPFGSPASKNTNCAYSVTRGNQYVDPVVIVAVHAPLASVVPLSVRIGSVSIAVQKFGSTMWILVSPTSIAATAEAAPRTIVLPHENCVALLEMLRELIAAGLVWPVATQPVPNTVPKLAPEPEI